MPIISMSSLTLVSERAQVLMNARQEVNVLFMDHTYVEERAECHLNNTNIVIRLESAYRPLAG